MIDLSFLKDVNWGSFPQWLTFLTALFATIFISRHANKLKEYEIKRDHYNRFKKPVEEVIKELTFLKRSIEIDIEHKNISDDVVNSYLLNLEKCRKNIPIWMITKENNSEEGSFLLIEKQLEILKKLSLKDRIEFGKMIISMILGCMKGLQNNIFEYAKSYDDYNMIS